MPVRAGLGALTRIIAWSVSFGNLPVFVTFKSCSKNAIALRTKENHNLVVGEEI